jgi:hypothetical protein
MILKFLKIIVIFLLQIYSKRTGKLHQSLVICTLEYIPKEKGGKRRFQKNIGAFLEGGKSTLEVAKTLDKIGFFKDENKKVKNRVQNTLGTLFFSENKLPQSQEKSVGAVLGGKRTIKSSAFCSTFSAKTPHKDFLYHDFCNDPPIKNYN